jgi:hypothetical protein
MTEFCLNFLTSSIEITKLNSYIIFIQLGFKHHLLGHKSNYFVYKFNSLILILRIDFYADILHK